MSQGPAYERQARVRRKVEAAGARVFVIEEPLADEASSVLYTIPVCNFLGYYLSRHLQVGDTFSVGGKVTEVL